MPSPVASAAAVRVAKSHVYDEAALLDASTKADIEKGLAAVEAKTRHRAVVVTEPTLDGHAMDEVAERIAKRLDLDDGVLLLLALREREVRIAVGRGSAHLLSNARAQKIISGPMWADLHANRFAPALRKGAAQIAADLSETIV